MNTCILVCEDLARIDPVGRYVRAVGPDLVIALLMDGPQMQQRWPAYHVTVLADDPGSSVLTLTSLGMAKLSRRDDNINASPLRTVAMWRDPTTGIKEITLSSNSYGAVLTISQSYDLEYTADG